jgi:hypothetical protein
MKIHFCRYVMNFTLINAYANIILLRSVKYYSLITLFSYIVFTRHVVIHLFSSEVKGNVRRSFCHNGCDTFH